jgi:hypothetical protein
MLGGDERHRLADVANDLPREHGWSANSSP